MTDEASIFAAMPEFHSSTHDDDIAPYPPYALLTFALRIALRLPGFFNYSRAAQHQFHAARWCRTVAVA